MALAWSFLLLLVPLLATVPGGGGRIIRLIVAASVSLLALPALRRDLLRHGERAITGLAWDPEGFEVRTARGDRERVRLCHGSLRAGRHAWLLFEGRRRHRVFVDARVLPAAEAASLWRALRRQGRREGELL